MIPALAFVVSTGEGDGAGVCGGVVVRGEEGFFGGVLILLGVGVGFVDGVLASMVLGIRFFDGILLQSTVVSCLLVELFSLDHVIESEVSQKLEV